MMPSRMATATLRSMMIRVCWSMEQPFLAHPSGLSSRRPGTQTCRECFGGMQRAPSRQVADLLAAADARRDDHGVCLGAHGRDQRTHRHRPADLFMLGFVA